MILLALLRKAGPAELRDIAEHIVTMRRATLATVHWRFHRVILIPDPYAGAFRHHGVHLTEHLGLAWMPGSLGHRITHQLVIKPLVFAVTGRILDRVGPCPGVHEEAVGGIMDAEAHANGEHDAN